MRISDWSSDVCSSDLRDGNLYIVDIPFGRIFRLSPEKEFTLVADYDGEPNGLKIHNDGRIFIADFKHGILQLDPAPGTVTPHFERLRLERFQVCIDPVSSYDHTSSLLSLIRLPYSLF